MPRTRKLERLPRGLLPERLLRGELGDWVARPWLDRAAFSSLSWYFPLSRMWASASVAAGDPDRFAEQVPLQRPRSGQWLLGQALGRIDEAAARYRHVDSVWLENFFGARRRAPSRLVRAELERRTAARIWMASRGLLSPLLANREVPAIRWNIPDQTALLHEFAPALDDPSAFYRPPEPLPDIERSHSVPGPEGDEYWLRFASKGGDTAWAKVYEPERPPVRMPTLILCHGLCVETEMWGTTAGIPHAMIRAGMRVVAPTAPWHGRRMIPGQYGGEPLIATAPRGGPDLFRTALGDIAALIAWARGQGSAIVAIGGTSLGALTTQVVATQACGWPHALRPDFLLLVTTSGSLRQVAVDSELGAVFGLGDALASAGWTDELLGRLSPLTDPLGDPVMPAERIVIVLGRRDSVTAFDEGRELAARWKVPEENLYIREQGHFSAAVGVIHDDAPIRHLKAMMDHA